MHNPLLTSDISAAALVRSIDAEDDPPTLMLDEADTTFGKALKRSTRRPSTCAASSTPGSAATGPTSGGT